MFGVQDLHFDRQERRVVDDDADLLHRGDEEILVPFPF